MRPHLLRGLVGLLGASFAFTAIPAQADAGGGRKERETAQRLTTALAADRSLWHTLGPADRDLAIKALTPAKTVVIQGEADTIPPATCQELLTKFPWACEQGASSPTANYRFTSEDSCYQAKVGVRYEGLFGNDLFGYFMDPSWCIDDGVIYSYSADPYPEVYSDFWKFEREVLNRQHGGYDERLHTAVGEFALCPLRLCIQHQYPKLKFNALPEMAFWWAE